MESTYTQYAVLVHTELGDFIAITAATSSMRARKHIELYYGRDSFVTHLDGKTLLEMTKRGYPVITAGVVPD